ncbi:class I SAM-dependent methyltransferase [Thiovibrio sp. JS02]
MTIPSPLLPVAVSYDEEGLAAKAGALAGQLGLPLVGPAEDACPLLLVLTAKRLELRQTGRTAPGPLFVDFAAEALSYRRRHSGSRKEAVARAVGLKGGAALSVLDVTAGLGRDGFILASLGCRVHLVERSPIVAALLADGLARAAADPLLAGIATGNLTLRVGDGLAVLTGWRRERPEVVYLDPMYPHRGKSALVKKEMRLVRLLVGDDEDSDSLLAAALAVATKRVVVKRPRLAPPLTGPAPGFTIDGRNSRFDVYLLPGKA